MSVPPLAMRIKFSPDRVSTRWFYGLAAGAVAFLLGVIFLLSVMKPYPMTHQDPDRPNHEAAQR